MATIKQTLKSSRDVLAMMENYKKNAGSAFVRELDIVTADIRSYSYEVACEPQTRWIGGQKYSGRKQEEISLWMCPETQCKNSASMVTCTEKNPENISGYITRALHYAENCIILLV